MERRISVVLDASGVESGAATAKNALNSVESSAKSVDRALSTITRVAAGLIAALGIRNLTEYADTWTLTSNRIRLVTNSQQELTTVQEALLASANRTRTAYDSTVELYARVARSADDLGLSQQELLGFTETVNQAIQVSGATSAEAGAGVIQFAQGLASGALRGDELRSVLEQMPRLASALADGLGVNIGKLRELGTEGALTTQVVLDALRNQAPAIRAEFDQLAPTIAQAFTVIQNNVQEAVGEIETATGASESLAKALIDMAGKSVLFARAISGTLDPLDEMGGLMKGLTAITILLVKSIDILGSAVYQGITLPFKIAGGAAGNLAAALGQLAQGNLKNAFNVIKEGVKDLDTGGDDLAAGFIKKTIEVGDAFEKIDKIFNAAKRSARSARTDLTAATGGGGGGGGGGGDDGEAEAKRADAVRKLIQALQDQAATFGFTAEQTALYRIQMAGATEEELAFATRIADSLTALKANADALEAAAAAAKKRAEQLEANRAGDAEFVRSLKDQVALFGASRQELAEYQALQQLSADATETQKEKVIGYIAELEAAAVAQEDLEIITQRFIEVSNDAARAITDSFADLVLGGKDAIDVMKELETQFLKIILNAAVFDPLEGALTGLFKGGLEKTGGLGGLVDALPGFANGASFEIGGRGGTDNNIVAFRGSLGEQVDVTPAGATRGNNVVNISLHGVTNFDSFGRSKNQLAHAAGRAASIAARRTGA